ncbi:hypothetical protein [Burkholderia sp. JKS000303]|uniref:hypothetical protein n=1 Tax=Burkholderia sp. JKS000303 TaxID=1938747 RepID=UPI0015CF3076|nr:hypothetical protein [Burkholderia sp. JKS000303]
MLRAEFDGRAMFVKLWDAGERGYSQRCVMIFICTRSRCLRMCGTPYVPIRITAGMTSVSASSTGICW